MTKKIHESSHRRLKSESDDSRSWVIGPSNFLSWTSKKRRKRMARSITHWLLAIEENRIGQKLPSNRLVRPHQMHGKSPARDPKFKLASGKFTMQRKISASLFTRVHRKCSRTLFIKKAWSRVFYPKSVINRLGELSLMCHVHLGLTKQSEWIC